MSFVNALDKQMADITNDIMINGVRMEKRNGARICTFGQTIRSNLKDGFPIPTQKYTNFDAILKEWFAMINGVTNAKDFGSKIWDQWGLPEDVVAITLLDRVGVNLKVVEFLGNDYTEQAEAAIKAGAVSVPILQEDGEVTYKEQPLDDTASVDQLAPALASIYATVEINEWLKNYQPQPEIIYIVIASKLTGLSTEDMEKLIEEVQDVEAHNFPRWMHEKFPNCVSEEQVTMEAGYLGPVYGAVARGMIDGVDQLEQLEDHLRRGGKSDRMVIDYWAPSVLPNEEDDHETNVLNNLQVLAPCHILYIFNVISNKLNCELTQRSADHLIGVGFNHPHLAIWVHALAHVHGFDLGSIKHNMTNSHIYESQLEDVNISDYLALPTYDLPELVIDTGDREVNSILDLRPEDFTLKNYQSGPYINIRCEA